MGKVTMEDYLFYLTWKRRFNEELIIKHTYNVYEVDISENINSHFVWYEEKRNIYQTFLNENPLTKNDDYSRQYFNSYARNRYLKFIDHTYFSNEDCLTHHQDYEEIHHIFPLVYGGSNAIENLIHISHFNHGLLHENPLEKNEKMCHQALDYLGCLYSPQSTLRIFTKYDIGEFSYRMTNDIFKSCIREEMRIYYENIL
jgi:hypothetical protein